MFPGSVVLKNDPSHLQGIPDLSIFYNNKWAMLEVKKGEGASTQPNQEYYVDMLNGMSYCSFIYPENREEVLYELQRALRSKR